MVGAVFLSEGIQKFLFPAIRGAGRFEKIGLPSPEFLGSFVGFFEIACGALILLGLVTRLAAIPTLVIMLVAIVAPNLSYQEQGFGNDARESHRLVNVIRKYFPVDTGGGCWSIDVRLSATR